MKEYIEGLKAGIPIGLGYLSVSFTFGIMAVSMGLTWWQAVLISLLTVTSAGQFSGIRTMMYPGHYMEMIISQLTINIRYSFMSISLGQKTSEKFNGIFRYIFGFFMTDEIFAVASSRKKVGVSFFAGLSLIPWIGWVLGTTLGAVSGNILPKSVMSALGLAIYGMFVAIVIPEVKKSRPVMITVSAAIALSCLFYYVPVLKMVPSGFTISICAIGAAALCAFLFPMPQDTSDSESPETPTKTPEEGHE